MSFTEFPIPSVELASVAANARSAINAMENTNDALNNAIEADLSATLVSLGATDGANGASDAGKLAKFDANGALAVSQSINLSTTVGSVVDADAIGIAQASAANISKKATLSTLWSWIVSKIGAITNINAGGAWTFTGSTTVTGASTFNGQVELSSSQAATTGNSAISRSLGDSRYGVTYVGIKTESVESTDNTPIKLTSVILPVGIYQIDSNISAFAATANGGYVFGLRADKNIRISLFDQFGADGLTTFNAVAVSDSTTHSPRAIATSTTLSNKRQLMGLLEVISANTEVSIEFCQNTTVPLVPAFTRKRSYIIARKIS
jgi:hypothetical protein